MSQLATPVYRVYFDRDYPHRGEQIEVYVIPSENVYYIDGECFCYDGEDLASELSFDQAMEL